MKLTGITGTGTGKLGSSVFAVNSGTQIVRQYQPVVANPSTEAQVEQRAKLKLASQLARDLKKAIAMPRQGLVSARNRFMSKNFPLISFAEGTASAQVPDIQLTESTLGFPTMIASWDDESKALTVSLPTWIAGSYEKVQVEVFNRNNDGTLSHIKSATVDAEDFDLVKRSDISITEGSVGTGTVVYAYGFNLTSDRARAAYANMSVNEGATIASLITSRVAVSSDIQLSRTSGANLTV